MRFIRRDKRHLKFTNYIVDAWATVRQALRGREDVIEDYERETGNASKADVVGYKQCAAVNKRGRGMNRVRGLEPWNNGAKTRRFPQFDLSDRDESRIRLRPQTLSECCELYVTFT